MSVAKEGRATPPRPPCRKTEGVLPTSMEKPTKRGVMGAAASLFVSAK